MSEVSLHPGVELIWHIANKEARRSASDLIEPIHLWVGGLSLLDGAFLNDARELGLATDVIDEINHQAEDSLPILNLPVEQITLLRRRLQKQLHRQRLRDDLIWLHRSESSRRIFQRAQTSAISNDLAQISLRLFISALCDAPIESELGKFISQNPAKSVNDNITRSSSASNKMKINTPELNLLGRDLTDLAQRGQLPLVVGCEAEMTSIARILHRTSKRNVILVGDAGVGKTAIIEGLAQKLVDPAAPEFLSNERIVQLNIADLVAGTMYRGSMEDRLSKLIEEAASDPNLILFFDEIHLVMKSGNIGGSSMDIANILKPALARDEIRCIGATTTEEYERYIKDDSAFKRRFHVLRIKEPSPTDTLPICRAWAKRIESRQHVHFEEQAIQQAIDLSVKFLHDRSLPDKAIDLLENAATFVTINSLDFSTQSKNTSLTVDITVEHIRSVLQEQYGILTKSDDMFHISRIEERFKSKVVGQDDAIKTIVDAFHYLELRPKKNGPLGVLLFSGPTGCGKTLSVECIAEGMFDQETDSIIRFNMNEYIESYDVSRLTGAAPGLIGHDRQGPLFQFAESHLQGIILLEDIPKAHPNVQDFFLQILDSGEARDSRGRLATFRGQLFVLTCTVNNPLQANKCYEIDMRPELLSRVDQAVHFRDLSIQDYEHIFDRELDHLVAQIKHEHSVDIMIDNVARLNAVIRFSDGTDRVRGFLRAFEHNLAVPMLRYIRSNPHQSVIQINWANDTVQIT